ncbi:MAG: SdrD B-like domain-containing protein [Bdellovibrio sp.]
MLLIISGFARAGPPNFFVEENQFIMAVSLEDGTLVSNSIDVYRTGNSWYLPFTALTDALNFAITASPALGQAEGFYIEEYNHFKLDKNSCLAIVKNEPKPFPCEKAVIFDDEIYVDHYLLEEWFQLHFKINPYSSEITISAAYKFPKQLRNERQKKTDSPLQQEKKFTEKYDEIKLEDKKIGEGSFDQQLMFLSQNAGGNTSNNFRHDTAATIEMLGFQTKGFLGGQGNSISESSLNLSKKDPEGKLLGPLNARSMEFIDVISPEVPLIAPSNRTKGLLISSYPLNQPTSFSSKDFRGPLPSNWDVELYQNDILIGRHQADTSTEYEFKEVTLYYGVNRFRLVFYGPQGQRREQVEIVNVGQQATAPQESYYRFGVGQKTDDPDTTIALAQFSKGLTSNLTAGFNYYQEKKQDSLNPADYFLTNLSGSFSRFYATLNLAGNDKSGTAAEIILQAPFEGFAVGASHASFSNFRSYLFNSKEEARSILEVNKLNGNFNLYPLLPIRIDGELQENKYDDGTTLVSFKQRMSWQIGRSFWFNTLSRDVDADPTIAGELITILPYDRFEYRTTTDYKNQIESLAASMEYRFSNKYSYILELKHALLTKTTSFQGSLSKRFSYATLGAELASDTGGNYRVSGLISYSCTENPRRSELEWSPLAQTQFGAASVRVFLDKNYNGKFDGEDTVLPEISLWVNQNDVNTMTDMNGEAMILQLPAYQPSDITISLKSLPDPLYTPSVKGLRLTPRPGQVSLLEFPVVVYGEIDGTVQVDKGRGLRGVRNIQVQLRKISGEIISTVQTEADGFFLFKEIRPGDYKVTLETQDANLKNVVFLNSEFSVKVSSASDNLVSTVDFFGRTKIH